MSNTASQVQPGSFSPETTSSPTAPRLRLWPAVVIVALMWLLRTVPVSLDPGPLTFTIAMFAPMVAVLLLAGWWLFASRVRLLDKLLVLGVCVAAGVATWFLCHPSTQFALIFYALPAVVTAWTVWLLGTLFLSWPARRTGLLLVLVLAWGWGLLVRMDGTDGSFAAEFSWRWSPTAEQKFLAERGDVQPTHAPATEVLTLQPGDWPGFRGPDRDGRRTGVRIATDWKENPPRQLWRHRVGPGWSSFAVVGTRAYTQEQRGDSEVVVCYHADTGKELWAHEDSDRFTETVSGPGPRATPTFHDGKIYALGAKGQLNCLDAATGKPVWARNIVTDAEAKVPEWGFAASPLVVDGVVTVLGGPDGKGVLAYYAATGSPAWSGGDGKHNYCSTHRARLGGVEQVLAVTAGGVTAFQPKDGKELWQYSSPLAEGMARVIQPAVLNDSDFLIGSGFGGGTQRVRVTRDGDGWKQEEIWTTKAISPYFNDLVTHKNHLYGFEGIFLTCVNLDAGEKGWRARGYGNGQVMLLPDQDLLLVLSEKGEVALVQANPESHTVVGRFQAIKGKTWNHPVVANGKLFVRNGEEAACYQLTEAGSGK